MHKRKLDGYLGVNEKSRTVENDVNYGEKYLELAKGFDCSMGINKTGGDFHKACEYYLKSFECGNMKVVKWVIDWGGNGVAKKVLESINKDFLINKIINSGDSESMYRLGLYISMRQSDNFDKSDEMNLYEQAAHFGHSDAYNSLVRKYFDKQYEGHYEPINAYNYILAFYIKMKRQYPENTLFTFNEALILKESAILRRLHYLLSTYKIEWDPNFHFSSFYSEKQKQVLLYLLIISKKGKFLGSKRSHLFVLTKGVVMRIIKYWLEGEVMENSIYFFLSEK